MTEAASFPRFATMRVLDNFAFVLVRPQSPGNVGAAARAMKNMGLSDLRLVAPARWSGRVAEVAEIMAVHASDVLDGAHTYASLAAALEDRTRTVGTTCRSGPYRSGLSPIRTVATELIGASAANRVAIVFGPEDSGLSNQELKLCQRLVTIPTAPAYPSLNLAQAVMVVAYELMLAAGDMRELPESSGFAAAVEVDAMLERMARALVDIGFLPEDNPDHLMFALRELFGRGGIKPRELDILSGIARQVRWFAEGGYATVAAKRRAGLKLR
ncbi:MAG: RNA methyltransferase [Candidatus Binataceae bacterium]